MERRNFFKLLGAALLPLPYEDTINTVCEVAPIINPHKPGTIEWFLCQEAERIGRDIYKKVMKEPSPWTQTYKQS